MASEELGVTSKAITSQPRFVVVFTCLYDEKHKCAAYNNLPCAPHASQLSQLLNHTHGFTPLGSQCASAHTHTPARAFRRSSEKRELSECLACALLSVSVAVCLRCRASRLLLLRDRELRRVLAPG